MRSISTLVASTFVALVAISTSASAAPIFVGSWQVDSGPPWPSVPPAYSGDAAATLLFGAAPVGMEYAISTIDANPLNVNFSAWVSTWGGACAGTFPCGTVVDDDFAISSAGLYANVGDTSAYVTDWAVGAQYTNFAFLVPLGVEPVTTPESTPIAIIAVGLLSLLTLRLRRRQANV